MMKIRSIPHFFYEKIDENNPLTTPIIKIYFHPSAILFVHVLLIHSRSLTHLKCLVLEKVQLLKRETIYNFIFFTLLFLNISENTEYMKKI